MKTTDVQSLCITNIHCFKVLVHVHCFFYFHYLTTSHKGVLVICTEQIWVSFLRVCKLVFVLPWPVCLLRINKYIRCTDYKFLFAKNLVVNACTANAFKACLDQFWQHQIVEFNFTADLTGTGNRSEELKVILFVL